MPFDRNTTGEQVTAELHDQINGKTVLITGPSKGSLGGETARLLAKHGAKVILAGRSASKLDEAIDEIKKETPAAKLSALVLDLSSLESVRSAAANINASSDPLHVLINNAGIMAVPFELRDDKYEAQFGTNHLAHFLLTSLVYRKLAESGTPEQPSRVVNVTSNGHSIADVRWDDLHFEKGKVYNKWRAYGQAKTANILFTYELAKRAKRAKEHGDNVLSYAVHPGAIQTNLLVSLTDEDYPLVGGVKNEKGEWELTANEEHKTLENGVTTHLVAAFDPSIREADGSYLADGQVANDRLAEWAKPGPNGARLWTVSEDLVSQKFDL